MVAASAIRRPVRRRQRLQLAPVPRCFLFKPDGIGDFFLASGVVHLMAREFGEENLTIAVLPVMECVVRGQFPKATLILLPIRKKRVFLNVFAANCIRCFLPFWKLRSSKADISVSLRYMRDYLMNVLFYSVPSQRRLVVSNGLLGNGRPVRRWVEKAFVRLFRPVVLPYPAALPGVPSELEANRRLASAALLRDVQIQEVWPKLTPRGSPSLDSPYWVCAPFANGEGKDFPIERWVELFTLPKVQGNIPKLVLSGSASQKDRLKVFQSQLAEASPETGGASVVIIPPGLQDFLDLLAGAGLVLTVDTAAAHAAPALDCRTLILFSGQHCGMFGPWVRSPRQRWIIPSRTSDDQPWHTSLEISEIAAVLDELAVL